MDVCKETIRRNGCKLLLDVLEFVGTSKRNTVANKREVFKLTSHWVKYSMFIIDRSEREGYAKMRPKQLDTLRTFLHDVIMEITITTKKCFHISKRVYGF
jgi:hypothetical protein